MTSDEFRAELKALELSQRALALRLGLAVTTVNRWALALAPVPQYRKVRFEPANSAPFGKHWLDRNHSAGCGALKGRDELIRSY